MQAPEPAQMPTRACGAPPGVSRSLCAQSSVLLLFSISCFPLGWINTFPKSTAGVAWSQPVNGSCSCSLAGATAGRPLATAVAGTCHDLSRLEGTPEVTPSQGCGKLSPGKCSPRMAKGSSRSFLLHLPPLLDQAALGCPCPLKAMLNFQCSELTATSCFAEQ